MGPLFSGTEAIISQRITSSNAHQYHHQHQHHIQPLRTMYSPNLNTVIFVQLGQANAYVYSMRAVCISQELDGVVSGHRQRSESFHSHATVTLAGHKEIKLEESQTSSL